MPPQTRGEPLRWRGDWFAAPAFVALWAATLLPVLGAAAASARLVEAFSTDEAMQVNLLAHALNAHSWAIRFGAYGHLYFNMVLLALKSLWPLSERAIVIGARAVSLASAAGLLLFAFWWARRAYGSLTAWLAMALVALNPTVYEWAAVVHPDMLQALCLLVALFFTVSAFERPTTARILVASTFAGLGFAAKYSGLFVLPLIAIALVRRRAVVSGGGAAKRVMLKRAALSMTAAVMLIGGLAIDSAWVITHVTVDGHVDVPLPMSLDAAIWLIRATGLVLALVAVTPWTWRMLQRWKNETVLWGYAVALTAFVTTFVIASPYSWVKLAFIKGLYYEAVETGAALNITWVAAWTRGIFTTIGLPIFVALGGTIIGRLSDRRRHVWSSMEIVLLVWNGLYLVVLLAPVHELLFHYALPMIAPTAILAAHVIVTATGLLSWRLPKLPRAVTASVIVALLAAFELPGVRTAVERRQVILRHDEDPAVRAGVWLADHVPSASRVVYDYYSYVPPAFANATGTWGATREWLASVNPDIVVVNRDVSPMWRGPHREASYSVCLRGAACITAIAAIARAFTVSGKWK